MTDLELAAADLCEVLDHVSDEWLRMELEYTISMYIRQLKRKWKGKRNGPEE